MKRILMSFIFVIALQAAFIPASSALTANSQSYTIGVVIPAIPGVNAPLLDPQASISANANDSELTLVKEETTHNNEEVVLMTFIGA